MTSRRFEHFGQWSIVCLTLLTLALRIADLTGRALWLDEGFTLLRTMGSWSDVAVNRVVWNGISTIDTNPQLYFALLKVWQLGAGESDFALRLLSVLGGVLFVPLTFTLGRQFGNWWVGFVAAALAFISPLVQWYSHELRMYSLVVCLAGLTTALVYRAMRITNDSHASGARIFLSWLAWLGVSIVALLTHYSFAGLLIAHAAILVWAFAWRLRWSRGLPAAKHITLAAALCAGIAALVLHQFLDFNGLIRRITSGAEYGYEFKPITDVVGSVVSGMMFGINLPDPSGGIISWVALGIFMGGVAWLMWLAWARRDQSAQSRQTRVRLGVLVVSLVVPVLAWYAVSFVKPNFAGVRHLMLTAPMILVLTAMIVDRLARQPARLVKTGGLAALLAVLGINGWGSAYTFIRTPNSEDDWRGVARYIRNEWREGDIVVTNSGTPNEVLHRYLGDLPISIASLVNLPSGDEAPAILNATPRIWFMNTGGGTYGTPGAPTWLNKLPVLHRVAFGGRTTVPEVVLLEANNAAVETLPARVATTDPVNLPLAIAAYQITLANPYATTPNMRLTLFWHKTATRSADDIAVSFRLTNRDQVYWDWSFDPQLRSVVERWEANRLYALSYVLPLPIGLPMQPYQMEIVMRAGDKGEPAQRIARDIDIDTVRYCLRITDWNDAWSTEHDAWRGRDVGLARAEFPSTIKVGQPLPVVLIWRALHDNTVGWESQLTLKTLLGSEIASATAPAGTHDAPVSSWPAGQPVRTMHSLNIPADVSGWFQLGVSRQRDGVPIDSTSLGWILVEPYKPTPVADAAAIQHPIAASVGETELLGYSTRASIERGTTVDFITHWRVTGTPRENGVLFLHTIQPNGQPGPQDDNPPERGARSTGTYQAGSGIDQLHRIAIPADAPAGTWELYAGIYDQGNSERWPATQNGQPAKDNLVYLGSFQLP